MYDSDFKMFNGEKYYGAIIDNRENSYLRAFSAEDIKDKESVRKSLAEYFLGKTIIRSWIGIIREKKLNSNAIYYTINRKHQFVLMDMYCNVISILYFLIAFSIIVKSIYNMNNIIKLYNGIIMLCYIKFNMLQIMNILYNFF